MEHLYKIIQDDDCHWYWIPLNLLEKFEKYVENREDDSEILWDQFRTGWHKDLIPDYWKDKI